LTFSLDRYVAFTLAIGRRLKIGGGGGDKGDVDGRSLTGRQ